ncbi:MAG: hypothetical protein JSV96_04335, partial [Candidatus Aminicenantes bacterium]
LIHVKSFYGPNDNRWGEFGENRSSNLGASTLFANPNYHVNVTEDDPLGMDPTHMVKIFGAFDGLKIDVIFGIY